jgi:hypothetical protein
VVHLAGHPLGGAQGDVGADLHPVEGDPARRIVRAFAGGGGRRPEGGDVEDAAAGGDDLAVAGGGARVTAQSGSNSATTPVRPPGSRAARKRSSRSERIRGSTACVSGSPKRTLNSSTFGPSAPIIRPA